MLLAASAALALALPASAQEEPKGAPAPSEIVAAAPKADWVAIAAEDLLVMTRAPDAEGKPRRMVIQLMPEPFSQGWVNNIRIFARSGWYDGISVNRVQDNYVTQWGDPNYDNPEATGTAKPLPEGLKVIGEAEYTVELKQDQSLIDRMSRETVFGDRELNGIEKATEIYGLEHDVYGELAGLQKGWPTAITMPDSPTDNYKLWPTHCYGMVGVGRNYSPDTGSGAELYTVIGHAPRHLDRNIALVGRVIEGMQHLSSLPRGSGDLGFYTAEEAAKRTPILSVRLASDLPEAPASSSEAVGQQTRPAFEYLSTESATFATYADAIANRRDPFFITPAGGADICNIRVPVREVTGNE